MPQGEATWQPIETAPKDGSRFLCLIDGLPYAARFDGDGRFVWYWHSDEASGPSYLVHRDVSEGKTLLEETKPRDPPNYVPRGHLWVKGFDEQKRTHWMPLSPSLETPRMTDLADYQSNETSWRYGARRSELQSRIEHVERALEELRAELTELENRPPRYDLFNWSA